jgi:hypothetical protein
MRQFSMRDPERAISVSNVPRYSDLVKNDVGYYYHDPKKVNEKNVYYN